MTRLLVALSLTCCVGCASADTLFAPKGTRGKDSTSGSKGQETSANRNGEESARPSSGRQNDRSDECQQIGRYVEAGEHKLAVDDYQRLDRSGESCSVAVEEQVGASRLVVLSADSMVEEGLDARDRGDFEEARRSFGEALVVYPKYYWVQKLLRDISEDPGGEEALAEARQAQEAGDIPQAVRLTHEAIATRAAAPQSSAGVVEFASQLGLQLFNAGELVTARDLWEAALLLDPGNEALLEYRRQVDSRLRNLEEIKQQGR